MTVAFVKSHTVVYEKVLDTSIDVTVATTIPAGNLIVASILFDNAATASKPVVSSIAKMAGETASWVFLGASRSTSTSIGAFASGELWAIKTTVAWSAANYTVTLDTAVTMKATGLAEFSGADATMRSTTGTAYSTTTTAAAAASTGTTPAVGDLALTMLFQSNSGTSPTGSSNVAGGTWSTGTLPISQSGNAATNNAARCDYKILTSTGHQTANSAGAVTAGNGSIVAILQATIDPLITQAAYRLYADGPENDPLVDSYSASNYTNYSALATPGTQAYQGQSFLGNGGTLSRARFYLIKGTNTPTAGSTVTANLYAHTGTYGSSGLPTGSPVATSTAVQTSPLVATPAWFDFDFDSTVTLASGTPYFMVLQTDNVVASAVGVCSDWTSPTHSGNAAVYSTASSTWSATASYDFVFEVYSSGGAIALAAQDTAPTVDVASGDANLALRVRLQETAGGTPAATDDWQLQWLKDDTSPTALCSGYDETNRDATQQLGLGWGQGQSFLGDGLALARVGFYLGKNGTPAGTSVAVELYAHTGTFGSGGTGTGPVLARSITSVPMSAIGASLAWFDFDFDRSVTLANGTPYVVLVRPDISGPGIGNCLTLGTDTTAPAHPGTLISLSSSSWSSQAATDVIFRVYTSPTPTTWTGVADAIAQYTTLGSLSQTVFGPGTTVALIGQTFLGNGRSLGTVSWYTRRIGSPTGNSELRLYAHTGTFGTSGLPTGPVLATSAPVDVATISTSNGWVTYAFDGTFTLTNGTPYCLVLAPGTGSGSNGSNGIYWMNSSSGTAPGNSIRSLDGTTFAALAGSDSPHIVRAPAASVIIYDSPNLTDAATTANRLSAGTGTFTPGEVSETGVVTDLGWTASGYTELLYALTLRQADLTDADTLRFRVLRNGATTSMTYASVPTLTVIKVAAPVTQQASADLTAASTLTTTGTVVTPPVVSASADLTAVSTLTTTGVQAPQASVALTATSTLAVSATVTSANVVTASAALIAASTLTTTGVGVPQASVALTAASTLISTATVTGANIVSASAALTAVSTLTTTGVRAPQASVALTAVSTLTTTGVRAPQASAALTAVSTLTTTGLRTPQAAAALTTTSTLTATGTSVPVAAGAAGLTATATLTATVFSSTTTAAALTATSTLGATATLVTSSFSPPNLAGLVSWYDAADASTFTYSSGTSVSQWRDKSGKNWHLLQASVPDQPSRSRVINGKTTVTFGGNAVMDTGPVTTLDVSAATVCFVLRDTSTANYGGLISAHATTGSDWDNKNAFSIGTGVNRVFILECANSRAEFGGTEPAEWAVRTAQRLPDGTHAVWSNGVGGELTSSATPPFGVANGGILIGGRFLGGVVDAGYRMNGQVAEVVIYDRVLSDTERGDVETYLHDKWLVVEKYGTGKYGTGIYGGLRSPGIVTASAALSATATLTANPSAQAAATLTASSTLAATAVATSVVSAALGATSTLGAAGVAGRAAAVPLTAVSTLVATGDRTVLPTIALSAVSTLTTAGVRAPAAAATFTATSTLTTTGTQVSVQTVTLAQAIETSTAAPITTNPLINVNRNPNMSTGATTSYAISTTGNVLTVDSVTGGVNSLKCTQSGTSQIAGAYNTIDPIAAGSAVTIAFDYLLPVGTPVTTINLLLAETAVTLENKIIEANPVADGAWHRVVYNTTLPVTNTLNRIHYRGVAPTAVPSVINFRRLTATGVPYDGAYFDGDTSASYPNAYQWNGTVGLSSSTRIAYPALVQATEADTANPITVNPLINNSKNPNFAIGTTTSWTQSSTGSSVAIDTVTGGVNSLKVAQSGAGSSSYAVATGMAGMPEGTPVTIAYDFMLPVGSPITALYIQMRDSVAAAYADTLTIVLSSTQIAPYKDGQWHRIVYWTTVQPGFTANQVYHRALGPVAAHDWNLRRSVIVPVWYDGTYFDGDTPPDTLNSYKWTGTIYNSASQRVNLTQTVAVAQATETDTAQAIVGVRVPQGAATLVGVSVLTATAFRAQAATVSLAATSILATGAARQPQASASLTAVSTLSATADRQPQAAASLVAASTLATTATRDQPASVSLTSVATLGVSAVLAPQGAAALTAVSSLSATADRIPQAAGSLVAASVLTATADRIPQASASLTAASTLSATADRQPQAAASLTATSTLTATATGIGVAVGAAALSATSTLVATAVRAPQAAASLSATSTLTATGTSFAVPLGSAGLTASSTLTADATRQVLGTVSLTAASTLSTTGLRAPQAAAALTATSTLTAAAVGIGIVIGSAGLSATSTLAASAVITRNAAASLAASSTLSATADRVPVAAASLVATSTLVSDATRQAIGTTALSATSTLTITGLRAPQAAVTLSATSTLTTAGVVTEFATVTLTATSVLTATADRIPQAAASLVAGSSLTATAFATRPATASLTATSTLTPTAVGIGVIPGAASLSASSTLVAAAVRAPQATASLTAVSTLAVSAARQPEAAGALAATSVLTTLGVREQQATTALAAVSTLTTTGLRAPQAAAALTATSTLTATAVGIGIGQGSASLVATSTLTTSATRQVLGTVALTSLSTLSTAGVRARQAAASLTATSSLVSTALRTAQVGATLSVTSTLSTTGVRAPQAAVALTASSTLTTTATRVAVVTVALSATSMLVPTAIGIGVLNAAAALTATSTLTTAAVREPQAAGSLVAASTLTAAAVRAQPASIALSATSTLAVGTARVVPATAALTTTSTLTVAGERQRQAAGALSAASTLTTTAVRTVDASATLAATSTLFVSGFGFAIIPGAAALSVTSTLSATGVRTARGTATLSASSTLGAGAERERKGAVALTASSTLSTVVVRQREATTALSATAKLTIGAVAIGIVEASSDLVARSTLTAGGVRKPLGAASLTATSLLTAAVVRSQLVASVLTAKSTLATAPAREKQSSVSLSATSKLTVLSVRQLNALAALRAVATLTAQAKRVDMTGGLPNAALNGQLQSLDADHVWYPVHAIL